MREHHKKSQKYKYIGLGILVVAAVVVALLIFKNRTARNTAPVKDTVTKTTSTAPSAQSDFSDGGARNPSSSSDKGTATITDSQGQQTDNSSQDTWSTSTSGEITVYKPVKNALLEKNSTISGASQLATVYFRVIDDVSGKIAEGQLSVVAGKFSGNLSFNTTAATGRLDIYGRQDSGKEFSVVAIPVRFK